jgi:hypothetical protein
MRGAMHIFRPGEVAPETIQLIAPPPLELLRNAVGGDIEAVPYFTRYRGQRCVALCNEHGKLRSLPYNQTATAVWRIALRDAEVAHLNDYLAGPVAVVTGDADFMAAL